MIPDIELQLQAIVKSLKDNVAPAVEASNQLAQQQMQLSLAALEITLEHLPLVHGLVRRDLKEHLNLAEQLLALSGDTDNGKRLKAVMHESAIALEDAECGFTQLQQHARDLRDVIGIAIAREQEACQVLAIEQLVMDTCSTSLTLGRAWNKPMGFEPAPDAVPDLVSLLDYD